LVTEASSCCDIDAEQQQNWNQFIQSSSIHPSIQTGAFVGAAGSLVADSITITYGMPDEVEQDDTKYSTILTNGKQDDAKYSTILTKR